MSFLEISIAGAQVLLGLGFLFAVTRIVKGPTLADRVVALDLFGILCLGLLLVTVVRTGLTVLLDVTIVLALIGFIGTVVFARHLEKLTQEEPESGGGGVP